MKVLSSILKILAYTVLTLFLIGLISRLGENYGRFAVLISLIFWVSFYYIKYKRMEQMVMTSPTSGSFPPNMNTVASMQMNATSVPPSSEDVQSTDNNQTKSVWVTVMGVANILLLFISSKYFLVAFLASLAMAVGGSSLSYFIYRFLPLLWLVYLIITIIAVYRSFTKRSPILSLKDSHYFVFWPLILVGTIGVIFLLQFLQLI